MSEIIPFDSAGLPAHLRGATANNSDLSAGVAGGYPILSIKGKVWHILQNGERHLVTRPGTDDEPASALRVVILKANPNVSKLFYREGYEEGSKEKPTCYSNDGVAPAMDAQERQSKKCATCPHNAWGSRITENGAKGKACSDSRRIAVAAAGEIDNPMLLRIPAATLRDLAAFGTMLDKRNVPYHAVMTKISFDHSVAHPKLVFKAEGFLTADQFAQAQAAAESDLTQQIIAAGTGTGTPDDDDADDGLGETPAHLKPAAEPVPAPKAAPKAAAPKATPKPAAAAKAAPKPVAEPTGKVTESEIGAAMGSAFGEPAASAPAKQASPAEETSLADEVSAALGDALAVLDD